MAKDVILPGGEKIPSEDIEFITVVIKMKDGERRFVYVDNAEVLSEWVNGVEHADTHLQV